VVDGDREDDLVDVGGEARQVDVDRLVVARALAGAVVARVDDGLVRGLLVVEEDEVGVGVDLALRVDRDGGGIQVEVRAGGGADVPAEAHGDGGQARSLLGERDVATLGQAYSHGRGVLSLVCVLPCGVRARSYSYPYERHEGYRRFHLPLLSLPN